MGLAGEHIMPRMQMNFKGFDTYMNVLRRLGDKAEAIEKIALYKGAEVTANEVRNKVSGIPTNSDAENLTAYHNPDKKYRMSVAQKAGLLKGLGVAKHEVSGDGVNTVVGFDGYNDVITAKYPQGQPNQLVARIYEHGTSYSAKQPFMRQAKNAAKSKVEGVMIAKAEECYRNIIKGQGG